VESCGGGIRYHPHNEEEVEQLDAFAKMATVTMYCWVVTLYQT